MTITSEISTRYYHSPIGRINPEEKTLWIEALLSGKYEQGQFMLQTPDGKFCCLGVYCDLKEVPYEISRQNVQYAPGQWAYTQIPTYGMGFDKQFGSIPRGFGIPYAYIEDQFHGSSTIFDCIIQGSEKRNPDGVVRAEAPHHHTLQRLNDGGFTFAQIADIINYFL
jgi:hypothetical protein